MTEQQPIIVPSRSPSPVLPDYDEEVRPSTLELTMNWVMIDDAQVSRAQLGSFVRNSAHILEYTLRADVAWMNAIETVSGRGLDSFSVFIHL